MKTGCNFRSIQIFLFIECCFFANPPASRWRLPHVSGYSSTTVYFSSISEPLTYRLLISISIIQGALSISEIPRLNETDEFRLMQVLFGGYNISSIRPVKNSTESVKVEFQMRLSRLVKVNSREMTLVTDVWITQKWTNPFLKWTPKEYGGIETIHVHPRDVWVPDTALINNAESDFAGSRTKYKTLIVLKHNGENVWMSPATFVSSCRFDVSTFPFDTQLCDMTFGSWTFPTNKMTVVPMAKTNLFADRGYESGDWVIPTMKLDEHVQKLEYGDDKFSRITYRLKLERRSGYFIMYLIVPTVLISLLVLFSFKIPVDSGERIGLCTTSLLAMSVFLLLIGEYLPESSENLPLLAIASVLIMVEITLSFLGTIIVLKCHYNTTKPPKFLRVLCCVKEDAQARASVDVDNLDPNAKQPTVHALLQAQMSMIDKKEDRYQQQWRKIAKTMDRIFFYLFLATLVGTLAGVYILRPYIVKLERDL